MKIQSYVLEQLLGMQPWRSPGSSEFRPRLLERFSFSRPEGYEIVDQAPVDLSEALTFVSAGNVGKDGTGLGSFLLSNGDLLLTKRTASVGTIGATALPAGVEYGHIAAFGAYADKDHFAGLDLDGDAFGPSAIGEPSFSNEQVDSGEGGEGIPVTGAGAPTHAEVACFHGATDQYMAVVGDQLYASNENDYATWDAAPVTLPTSGTWRQMVSNGNTIIIVGDSNVCLRYGAPSGGGAPVWTAISIETGYDFSGVAYGDNKWVATSSDSDRIYWSGDDGLSWTRSTGIQGVTGETLRFNGIGYDISSGRFVAAEGDNTRNQQTVWVTDDPVDWLGGRIERGPAIYSAVASNNQGTFVVIASERGPRLGNIVQYSQDGGDNFLSAYRGADAGLGSVEWNGYQFVAAGYDASDGNHVATSDDGTAWSNRTSQYDLTGAELGDVVVGSGGTTLIWARNAGSPLPFFIARYGESTGGSGGSAEGASRLEAGEYEVVWLATVPTRAGKAVVASGEWSLILSGGSQGILNVTTPAAPAALVGNLIYEIYMRYAPEEVDEATGQFDSSDITGREFVLAAVIDAGTTDEQVWYPEIGRTLPDVGNVGTASMVKIGAYHQDRIWYRPSANEASYSFVHGEPAIDSLARPMTVAFTELEYLNLTGESYYLHLPAGNSENITGILSIPSGLIVFGENDAYLITGDPALQNSLNVEPFPDSVGCDDGIEPVAIAGRAFTVWRGRLYAIDGARAVDVSRGVLDGRVPVRDIAPDVNTKTIAVMTDSVVLHYDIEVNEWYQSEYLASSLTADQDARYTLGTGSRVLPSPTGLCFYTDTLDGAVSQAISTYSTTSTTADLPAILEWRGVDGGNALRRDYWRYVRIPLDVESGDYEVDESTFTATLYWRARPEQPKVETQDPAYGVEGSILNGELVFRLPWGYPSRRIDLRVVIATDQRVAFQPGISIGFSPGPQGDLLPAHA